jgi:DNA-binding CsgD family transcriptional regulator
MEAADHDPRLDELVTLVYDAALDDQLWAGLAAKIARVFDSTSTVLKTYGSADDVQLLEVTENLVVAPKNQAWADDWHRNDLWVERSVALGLGRVGTSQDLLEDAEYERTGFYQEWNRHLGIYYMVGAVFPIDRNTMGVLGIHRLKRAGAYGEEDRRRVGRFLPHLNRALRLRQRLEQAVMAQSASLDALDRLDTAVFVLDSDCRVLHSNRLGSRLLQDTPEVRVRAGRVRLSDPELDSQLLRRVREAIRTACGDPNAPGSAFTVMREGRLPITALVTPLRATWNHRGASSPAALVFMRDPEQSMPAQQTLRELFGLTPTEAAIAAVLAQGRALEQIAADFGIGIGTVRSHVKTILWKTGTHRQAQLVALLAHSVASIGSATPPI